MSNVEKELKIPNLYKKNYNNLYDVFLNASLQRSAMLKSPVNIDDLNLVTDRFRHERTWLMFLYVLIEAWESKLNVDFKNYLYSTQRCNQIRELLKEAKKNKLINILLNIRNYMAHRDKKQLWDQGRIDVVGNFQKFDTIHKAFSDFLLIPKLFIEVNDTPSNCEYPLRE